jgi:hypothetical protein
MNSYSQNIEDELLSRLRKLARRDKALYTAVQKKMVQIAENPYSGKPQREYSKVREGFMSGILC